MDFPRLIWIDMESTGFDNLVFQGIMGCQFHDIIEIAVLITDTELNILDEGLEIAIQIKPETMSKMDEWCLKHHGESGLIARCEESKITLAQAESMIIDYLLSHGITKGNCPMAGNTIRLDYMFASAQMHRLREMLHYRQFDVSMFKIATAMWDRAVYDSIEKKCAHRALDDIKESIEEMRIYKDRYFSGNLMKAINPSLAGLEQV